MDSKYFKLDINDDKKLAIYCLTIIAIIISTLIIIFNTSNWSNWLTVLSAIIGAIGGIAMGDKFETK